MLRITLPPFLLTVLSTPRLILSVSEREVVTLTLPHLWYIDSSATNASSNRSLLPLPVFFVLLPLGSSSRQPPTASHQLHHLWSPVTPESKIFITPNHPLLTFPPTKSNLYNHIVANNSPGPFPSFRTRLPTQIQLLCTKLRHLPYHTVPSAELNLYRPISSQNPPCLPPVSVQAMLFAPWNLSFAT